MIKDKLREVAQNVTWILIILGIPAVVISFRDNVTQEIPTWAAIMLGALVGGIVATPTNRIGNLIWQIMTITVERQIGKPEWYEQDSRKAEEYIQWKIKMRRASTWQIIKWNTKRTARDCIFLTAGIITVATITSIATVLDREETIGGIAILLGITSLAAFTVSFTIFIILLILKVAASKVYF